MVTIREKPFLTCSLPPRKTAMIYFIVKFLSETNAVTMENFTVGDGGIGFAKRKEKKQTNKKKRIIINSS